MAPYYRMCGLKKTTYVNGQNTVCPVLINDIKEDNTVMFTCFNKEFNIVNTFTMYATVNFMKKGRYSKKQNQNIQ